jgi:hypothetical protein
MGCCVARGRGLLSRSGRVRLSCRLESYDALSTECSTDGDVTHAHATAAMYQNSY